MVYSDLGRAAPAWKKCQAQKRNIFRNSAFFKIFFVVYTKTVRVFRILEVYTTGPHLLFGIHHGFSKFFLLVYTFLFVFGIHHAFEISWFFFENSGKFAGAEDHLGAGGGADFGFATADARRLWWLGRGGGRKRKACAEAADGPFWQGHENVLKQLRHFFESQYSWEVQAWDRG